MGIFSSIKAHKLEKKRIAEEKRLAAKAAEEARIAEKKRIYRNTKAKVDSYVNELNRQDDEAFSKAVNAHHAYADKRNSKCPHCDSTNVHMEYKRIVGELSGSSSSSGSSSYSHGLLWGSGSSHFNSNGKIDGSLDTIRVMKCSACGHEWEYTDEYFRHSRYYSGKIDLARDIASFMRYLRYILEVEYDPRDIKEKFDSYDEKRADAIDKFWTNIKYDNHMKTMPIEVLWTLSVKYGYELSDYDRKAIWSKKYEEDNWGDYQDVTTYCTKRDEYICEFSNAALHLLEELGFKHMNLTE